jgi:hypothetical protein
LIGTVSKTVNGETRSRVRIPPSPLSCRPVWHNSLLHGPLPFWGSLRSFRLWRFLWRFVAGDLRGWHAPTQLVPHRQGDRLPPRTRLVPQLLRERPAAPAACRTRPLCRTPVRRAGQPPARIRRSFCLQLRADQRPCAPGSLARTSRTRRAVVGPLDQSLPLRHRSSSPVPRPPPNSPRWVVFRDSRGGVRPVSAVDTGLTKWSRKHREAATSGQGPAIRA